MADAKAMGSIGLPAKLLDLGLVGEPLPIVNYFKRNIVTVWTSCEVPLE